MLSFFRKYQKFFFLFVTVIIVSSFAFFGTYQAFAPSKKVKDETLFVTNEGRKITQSYVQDFVRFLSLEPLSVRSFANILNDQVITKDFIETELAHLLIKGAKDKISDDFAKKHQKEKNFRPYKHPLISEISAENVWMTFAPQLKQELGHFTKLDDGKSDEAIASRLSLFLMERRFPGELLSYILRYQEKEITEMPKDPRLAGENLALFGYKDLNDWFGPTFIEAAANAIIKGADFARQQGYQVSKEEIVAEILTRREKAFQYYKNQWDNSYTLYQDCLKLLQMDELKVMSILEDILLFRRLFADVSGVNLVDTFALKKFYGKAHECVEAEIVQLPIELIFNNDTDLKRFEVYLKAVSGERENTLALPEKFDSVSKIKERNPELIATEYQMDLVHVSKKELEGKVTVKATWDWEEKNKDAFSELKDFETLDKDKRVALDAFARKKIVESHPEWVGFALQSKAKEEKKLVLHRQSKKKKLEGISDVAALVEQLEKGEVTEYSQDNENYYSFKLKDKSDVLLSFKEATEEGILDSMVTSCDPEMFDKLYVAIFDNAKQAGLIEETAVLENVKDKLSKLRFAYHMGSENKEKSPWPLIKKQDKIFRYGVSLIPFEQALAAEKKVFFVEEVGPIFYTQLDRRVEDPLPMNKMLQEEKFVSDEIKWLLLEKIIGNTAS